MNEWCFDGQKFEQASCEFTKLAIAKYIEAVKCQEFRGDQEGADVIRWNLVYSYMADRDYNNAVKVLRKIDVNNLGFPSATKDLRRNLLAMRIMAGEFDGMDGFWSGVYDVIENEMYNVKCEKEGKEKRSDYE